MAVGRQRPWFTTIGKCQITNLRLSQWSGHDLVQIPRHGRFLYEPKIPIVALSGFQLNSPERKKRGRSLVSALETIDMTGFGLSTKSPAKCRFFSLHQHAFHEMLT